MRAHPRLIALASFVVVGMVSLMVAGVLDWIVGILFLAMEFLGEGRPVRVPDQERSSALAPRESATSAPRIRRRTPASAEVVEAKGGRTDLGFARAATAPYPGPPSAATSPTCSSSPSRKCRTRHAELILLFLRPLAVTPMGPNSLPGLAEDDEARETFDRVGSEADRAGIPWRTPLRNDRRRPPRPSASSPESPRPTSCSSARPAAPGSPGSCRETRPRRSSRCSRAREFDHPRVSEQR